MVLRAFVKWISSKLVRSATDKVFLGERYQRVCRCGNPTEI
jgi:hypothetical protein